ncbi:MAG TPA: MFS transporter [Jiangellaceae bacterium]|nr:MFS transporter [Jiangellaceae bacterium]
MLGPYAEVLRPPGALAFSASGLVARLPMSMLGISIVLAVSANSGSYGRAGLVAAAALLAQAAAAPAQARIADQVGQARLLRPVLVAHGLSLGTFIVLLPSAPLAALLASAALAGATLPSFGAMVRARWALLYTGSPLLHPAYALESVLDEVVFVVGPVVATVLATGVHPAAGLMCTLVLTVGGGLVFAAQRRTEPRPRAPGQRIAADRLPIWSLGWIVVTFSFMGGIFGSVEVVTVAFTDAAGVITASGLLLAIYALGSLVSGLVVGAIRVRTGPRRRFVVGQALMAATLLPLPFVGPVAVLAVVLFAAGFAISPTLIAGFSLVEAVVPAARLTEGFAWISTALNVGVSTGAAVSGRVVDAVGAAPAYFVAVAFGLSAAATCLAGALVDRRRPDRLAEHAQQGLPE